MENVVFREAVQDKQEIKSQGFLSSLWSGFKSPGKLDIIIISSDGDLSITKHSLPSAFGLRILNS